MRDERNDVPPRDVPLGAAVGRDHLADTRAGGARAVDGSTGLGQKGTLDGSMQT